MLKLMIPGILLAALTPNAALAQEGHADIHVAYRDLDLKTPAGVKRFDRRLEWAISTVCGGNDNTDLARKLEIERCRKAKRADVAGQRASVLAYSARRDTELAATRAAR